MNANHKLSQKTYGVRHTRLHRPIGNATKKLGKGCQPSNRCYADGNLWHMSIIIPRGAKK